MTRYPTLKLTFLAVALISVSLVLPFSVIGTTSEDYALIVVSSYNGTDENELEKAEDLYDLLIEKGYSSDHIKFLTTESVPIKDGDPSTNNVENGFEWLAQEADSNSNVIIYVSDHSHGINSNPFYRFSNGNINESDVSDWLDDITYDTLTYITLGNKSGLIGSELTGARRVVISSMGATETADPDEFDIVNGLKDTNADLNNDNFITFIEAYQFESLRLTSSQTSVLWA
jgi:hypothetical protein